MLRDTADPSLVYAFSRVDDLSKAKVFTEALAAGEAARVSAVIVTPEVSLLSD